MLIMKVNLKKEKYNSQKKDVLGLNSTKGVGKQYEHLNPVCQIYRSSHLPDKLFLNGGIL
jgi:hypothetical protein